MGHRGADGESAPAPMASDGELLGVVAVGASAGGVAALTQMVSGLAPDLPYAVLVVLHLPVDSPPVLAQILDRAGPLRAVTARHWGRLRAGRIYVAPPGRHLLVHDGRIVLPGGPAENGRRTAIDVLFRSVASDFGAHAIGVLLSGLLDDGVAGLGAIRAHGGRTIVQRPEDAEFPDMPRHALNAGVADHTVAAVEIGAILMQLASRRMWTSAHPSSSSRVRCAAGQPR